MKSLMSNMSKPDLSKHHLKCAGVALVLCYAPLFSLASQPTVNDEIRDSVKQFLLRESTGLPGTVNIEVGAIDNRLNLTSCINIETYLPPGSRLWGRVNVGVRCSAPNRWAIYVPASVKVTGNYYVSAKPIQQGQTLSDGDITALQGDLTSMSNGIVTEATQALGHTSTMSLGPGIPLRQDSLRLQQVVIQGQTIRLISNGSGFKVSTEALALNNASEGQTVKVKINSGQVLSGIAKLGGIVEVIN